MTTLLNDDFGRLAVIEAQKYLLHRRMSRHWKRSLVIAWNEWRTTGVRFQLETLVNELNDANDTEIRELAELLAIVGGFTATIQDLSYWIDPVNGDDATGDGSQTNPYQSLWFLDLLPAVIRHYVRIMILPLAAGSVTLPEINTGRFTFEGDEGSLSIIGVGAPTVVSGPWTADTAGYTSGNGGSFINLPLAPIWTENDKANLFIRFLTGNLAGTAWPVVCNSNWGVYTIYTNPAPPSAGDTFDFVVPSVWVYTPAIQTSHRQSSFDIAGSETACRFGFYNLDIELGTPPTTVNGRVFISADTDFSFCRILCNSTTMKVSGAAVNETYPIDTGILTPSGCGITNIQWDGIAVGSQSKLCGVRVYGNDLSVIGNCRLQSLVCNSLHDNTVGVHLSVLRLYHCGFRQLSLTQANVWVESCLQNVRSGSNTNILNHCKYVSSSLTLANTETVLDPGNSYWYLRGICDLYINAALDARFWAQHSHSVEVATVTVPSWARIMLTVDPVANVLDGLVSDIYAPAGAGAYPINAAWPAIWTKYTEASLGLIEVIRGTV